MIKINGKYGEAKVFTDKIEDLARAQIENMMNQEWIEGSKVSIMPDVHAGVDGVIGLTILSDKLVVAPSLVGSDIGCGVTLFITDFEIKDEVELAKWIDEEARLKVPTGRSYHVYGLSKMTEEDKKYYDQNIFANFHMYNSINAFGTLGGGNHFIEAYNVDGKLAIAVHSGSRSMGGDIYKHYAKKAVKASDLVTKVSIELKIKELKEAGRHREIESTIKEIKAAQVKAEKEIPILVGEDVLDYINDVEVAATYAYKNRLQIFESITEELGLNVTRTIDAPHNFVEVAYDTLYPLIVTRKGAQSAYYGEDVLIPINMQDGLILGSLKGDPDLEELNYSFPHGAGRLMSRTKAKKELSLETFKEQMAGIYSTTIGEETLDEAPQAYKPLEEIKDQISKYLYEDSIKILKPFYNRKGGNE